LDHDVYAQLAPRQRRRAFLDRQRLDALLAHHDEVTVDGDVLRQPTQDRVVLQQRRQGVDVGEVVDRDDLDIGLADRLQRLDRAEEVASDTTEAVDTYPDSHVIAPQLSSGNSLRCEFHLNGTP